MKISSFFEKILSGFQCPGFFKAVLLWPRFSLASFVIVSRLIKSGIRPNTILDLGANQGQFAIASAKIFGESTEIISFEPDPSVAKILQKNVKGLPVEVKVCAVGSLPGTGDLFVNSDSQVSSLLPLGESRLVDFPNSVVKGKIQVPIVSLDNMFLTRKLSTPILLKIDVQGFEYEVITGASNFLKRVKWIVIEVSFSDLYKGEADFTSILKLLDDYGFHFLRPLNMHFSPKTGEVMEMDALFVNTYENTNI